MKKTTSFVSIGTIILLLFIHGCSGCKKEAQNLSDSPKKTFIGPFMNEDSILLYVQKQLVCGPRNPGSNGHSSCKEFLINFLKTKADTAFLQTFSSMVYGRTYEMSNIVASFSPDKKDRILLCAHWDSRPFADEDETPSKRTLPILGANDGASGVAVLLEMARTLSINKPNIGIDIILFDGEDLGLSGDLNGFFQGSRFASKNYPLPKPKYGILLDLVGDKQAEFRYEPLSQQAHSVLVDNIWSIAKERGSPYFIHETGNSVSDDHVMLNEQGIRTINIIDVNLVGNISSNPRRTYWHTSRDILDNLSMQTMSDVGNVLLDFLFTTSDSVY